MDHTNDYTSVAECISVEDDIYDDYIEDYISSENSIVYYVWNNMYDLKHHINHEYINHDDDPLTVRQYDNIMKFIDEIS